jgi:hypothetical protein
VLQEKRSAPVRVFVVWEPVILSDWNAPTRKALSRIPDARVAQFWDKKRSLSEKIRETARADPRHILGQKRLKDDSIVWDFVAVYPPGIKWDRSFPEAKFAGAPVVDAIAEVRNNLPN